MGMGQGVRTGLGNGGIICVLQAQFSRLHCRVCHLCNLLLLQFSMNISQTLQTYCGYFDGARINF